ncbi:MAG: glutathione S-transferase N-terminal domain-containing protein [Acidiferrobacterales bacterium]|nr:glutathione S-transferase N-terminal domain-containing protein [Acidiferrobacterales bacterium]
MAVVANRKSVITLFSEPTCWLSHRSRIVLAEKGVGFEVCDVDPNDPPEDLLDLNPYSSLPTLVDRDVVLYDSRVIIEYLDERFPHPPLMPVDPVNRARFRLALFRIENDWYPLLGKLDCAQSGESDGVAKSLMDSLTASAAVFDAKPYFLSDEFSLVDCSLAPLLWRLPHYGIHLPHQARPVTEYAKRLFRRSSFRNSLSAAERQMRP